MTISKYTYSQDREMQLMGTAIQIANENSFKDPIDVFKLDLERYDDTIESYVEKYYIYMAVLLFNKYKVVQKTSNNVVQSEPIQGGLIELNPRLSERIINNVLEVSINGFYPTLMINSEIELANYNGFKEIFSDIYKSYKNSNKTLEHVQEAKTFINASYGMLSSNRLGAYVKPNIDMSSITRKARMIMNILLSEFPGHYIYVDTDTIFFARYEEIEFRLEELLDTLREKYKLNIDITLHDTAIFLKKKKYLILEKGSVKYSKGIKTIP